MMYKKSKKLVLFLAISSVFLLAAGCNAKKSQESASPNVNSSEVSSTIYNTRLQVGTKTIQVALAQTPEQHEQGLSGKDPLTDEQGMLFIFETPTIPAFWMKNMKFDLDIVWIRKDKIIDIAKNVPAPKDPNTQDFTLSTYRPPSAIDSVLELPAGWSDRYNLGVNDTVILQQTN